jgi:hypothetical protein
VLALHGPQSARQERAVMGAPDLMFKDNPARE